MTNSYPVCYSCKRFFDIETGDVKSEIVSDAKPCERLCRECQERTEKEQWPSR
jgi:hypothetical protein